MHTQSSQSEERPSAVRQHAVAAVLIGLAAMMFFARLSLHPTDLLVGVQRDGRNDVTAHNLAARDLVRQHLVKEGTVLTWLDSGLLGSPWLGNPQSAMFYPPHWLFLIVESSLLMSWLLVAHHVWAGFGLYLYCRRLDLSWSAALVAGVAFAGAPFLIAQTGEGHSTQVFLIAWAPWAMLVYDGVRRGVPGAAAMIAMLFAIAFFCGHVQEVYYLVVILSGFVLCDCIRRERKTLVRPYALATTWCGIGVATAALVAVELIPNWIYTRFGVRSQGIDGAVAGAISAGPTSLWQLLNPFALGGPDNYQGPGAFYWETLCCFGIAPLLLAIVGAMQVTRRDRVLRWLLLGVITLLFAMGGDTPVFPLLHRYFPGMSLFRSPGRAFFFTSLAVAVLAAFGWDSIEKALRRLFPDTSGARVAYGASAAIALLCVAELSYYSNSLCATVAKSSLRQESPIVDALLAEPNRGRVLAPQELLSDRESLAHGVDKLRRYEPVPLARTLGLFNALAPDLDAGQEVTGFQPLSVAAYRKPLLDMLNVTHLVLPSSDAKPIEGWELVAQGVVNEELTLRGRERRTIRFAIYRNLTPLPPAFIVGEAVVSSSPSRLAKLAPRQEVMLEHDEFSAAGGERQAYRPALIVERRSDRVVVKAELDAPGYLVLSDCYYPGWRIETGERMLAANLAVRATPLEPGTHELTFQYTPPGRFIGGLVSGVAWLLVVGVLANAYRRRRIQRPTPESNKAVAAPPETSESHAESRPSTPTVVATEQQRSIQDAHHP